MDNKYQLPLHIREEIAEQFPEAQRLANYIHQHKIDFVLVPGAGAQTAAYMVKTVWKSDPKLKSAPMPLFFALARNVHRIEPVRIGDMPQEELMSLIKNRFGRHLVGANHKKVFILEECVHTGQTIKRLKRALESIGFKTIRAGTITYLHTNPAASIHVDISGVERGCPTYRGSRKTLAKSYQHSKNILNLFSEVGVSRSQYKKAISEVRINGLTQIRALRREIRNQAKHR